MNKFDMTDIRKKWDFANSCQADMDLDSDDIPALSFTASALMVCSSAKYMELLKMT